MEEGTAQRTSPEAAAPEAAPAEASAPTEAKPAEGNRAQRKRLANATDPTAAPQGWLDFVTIAEAEGAIEDFTGVLGPGAYLRRVAECILESPDITGKAERWHNLIGIYLVNEDYTSAMKLASRALASYPCNIGLLGDALYAAGESGSWEAGDKIMEIANSIPKRFWNWYLAFWASNFYKSAADGVFPENRSETIAKGIALVHECRELFPLEERLYNQEAMLLLADNRVEEARAVLESAIYQEHEANDGTPCMIPAAQCCLTYLKDILLSVNDYAKIIDIARRGVKSAATEEEKVKVAYFVFREALALDGSIHEEEERNHAKGFGNQELVRQALDTYELAYRLENSESDRSIIRQRHAILCSKGGVSGRALPAE